MRHLRNLSITILLGMFSGAGAQSQEVTHSTKHFEGDEITFEYPNDWTITENNSADTQTVTVAPGGNATQIVISKYDGAVLNCDFDLEGKKIRTVFSKRVAKVIKAGAATGSSVKSQLGAAEIEGIQLEGLIGQQPALGDVYTIRLHRHFVSLAFVRRVDDSSASSAWQIVRSSLRVKPPIIGTSAAPPGKQSEAETSGGVLNGKAISLPRPDYPRIARSAHASGMIVVQVTIDESGDVIAAHAISGHPLLMAASVASAKQAKFSPTKLCGEPVKVTGVITYNFVAM